MGNYTIWNGNKNRNQVKLNKLAKEAAQLDSTAQALNLQEQIAQLYVQILYSTEAINVNKESYLSSVQNEERGKEMVKIGKMSQADLAQLTAQRAQDEFNIVQAESNVKNYKRQLKELLQITSEEAFDIAIPSTTDQMALASNDLNIKIAKAGKLPTISANAGATTSTTSMNKNGWGSQMKTNFSMGGGIGVSIPLFDNRQTKTSVNKALIQRESILLDIKNEQG